MKHTFRSKPRISGLAGLMATCAALISKPALAQVEAPKTAPIPDAAPKFALLVGIADYSRDGLSKLEGKLCEISPCPFFF